LTMVANRDRGVSAVPAQRGSTPFRSTAVPVETTADSTRVRRGQLG
jgi:hypothetical protein